jgi:hypothetical protein
MLMAFASKFLDFLMKRKHNLYLTCISDFRRWLNSFLNAVSVRMNTMVHMTDLVRAYRVKEILIIVKTIQERNGSVYESPD